MQHAWSKLRIIFILHATQDIHIHEQPLLFFEPMNRACKRRNMGCAAPDIRATGMRTLLRSYNGGNSRPYFRWLHACHGRCGNQALHCDQ